MTNCALLIYEVRVMTFGLTNALALFQWLMQRVLMGLNTCDGEDFVAVYIDDVLVFSRTLEEHVDHLQQAGLKIKPTDCHSG